MWRKAKREMPTAARLFSTFFVCSFFIFLFTQRVNLSSHKVTKINELIESVGAKLKYLPLSSDFNPIELLWANIKSFLQNLKIRVKETLPKAITDAIFLLPNQIITVGFHTMVTLSKSGVKPISRNI